MNKNAFSLNFKIIYFKGTYNIFKNKHALSDHESMNQSHKRGEF